MQITKNIPVTIEADGDQCKFKCNYDLNNTLTLVTGCQYLVPYSNTCTQYDIVLKIKGEYTKSIFYRCEKCLKDFGE